MTNTRLEFVSLPEMNDVEYIGNRYNISYIGERTNETFLRKEILREVSCLVYEEIIQFGHCIEQLIELTTTQLLVLLCGGTYDEAMGLA